MHGELDLQFDLNDNAKEGHSISARCLDMLLTVEITPQNNGGLKVTVRVPEEDAFKEPVGSVGISMLVLPSPFSPKPGRFILAEAISREYSTTFASRSVGGNLFLQVPTLKITRTFNSHPISLTNH